MAPKKLSGRFKTISIECRSGHEVARYRKPKEEWGHRTHKLWLLEERIGRLATEPPILVEDPKSHEEILDIPPTGAEITCGDESCDLNVGVIRMVQGAVALVLNKSNLKPTQG